MATPLSIVGSLSCGDMFVSFITAVIGAGFGAYAGFWLAREEERKKNDNTYGQIREAIKK